MICLYTCQGLLVIRIIIYLLNEVVQDIWMFIARESFSTSLCIAMDREYILDIQGS